MTRRLAALFVVVHLVGSAAPAAAESRGPFEALGLILLNSGVRAPDFTLSDLDGNPVALSIPAGSPTLLVFWGTW